MGKSGTGIGQSVQEQAAHRGERVHVAFAPLVLCRNMEALHHGREFPEELSSVGMGGRQAQGHSAHGKEDSKALLLLNSFVKMMANEEDRQNLDHAYVIYS